jgi:predicted RNA methylase
MKDAEEEIERIYERNEGSESVEDYHSRHEIASLAILTITSPYAATREVDRFASRIRGKTVVEVGAGVGFLSIEMARFAKRVYAIEADPAWAWVFTECLYQKKPTNLTYVFGTAESVADIFRGDVAVIFTRSGFEAMIKVAERMCPEIIIGPQLPLEEHEPDAAPEDFAAAREAAGKRTQTDFISRHGRLK